MDFFNGLVMVCSYYGMPLVIAIVIYFIVTTKRNHKRNQDWANRLSERNEKDLKEIINLLNEIRDLLKK